MIEAKEVLIGSLNQGVEYVTPAIQEKTVTPKIEQQIVTPDGNIYALSKVTVEAVTNDIDTNINPENIRVGVEILGVQGLYEGLIASIEDDTLVFNDSVKVEEEEIIL